MNQNLVGITKINKDDVAKAVNEALGLINAKQLFTKPHMKILLKPNILIDKEPERAATTHPLVLKAVIQWLKQFNPEEIIVAESSGTFRRGLTDKAFRVSGLQAICEEENVEWTSFEKTPRKQYIVQDPLVLNEISASTLLEEVDLIINLPKIKTHGQCILTCSIKNMFGTLILGNKARIHAQFPTKERFNSALVDIYSVSKPQLTIIDGYYCQEGNGPSAGDVVKMDIILAGYDPVALDTTVCYIVGFDPKEIITLAKAEEKGLGTPKCEIIGESIESIKRAFKRPRTAPVSLPLPKFIAKYVGKAIFRSQIKFDVNKCKLCSTCWKNCPTHAINPPKEMKQGLNIPKWEKKKCIACYCCAELCPHEAVEFRMNIARNVLTSWVGVFGMIMLIGFAWILWSLISFFVNF